MHHIVPQVVDHNMDHLVFFQEVESLSEPAKYISDTFLVWLFILQSLPKNGFLVPSMRASRLNKEVVVDKICRLPQVNLQGVHLVHFQEFLKIKTRLNPTTSPRT